MNKTNNHKQYPLITQFLLPPIGLISLGLVIVGLADWDPLVALTGAVCLCTAFLIEADLL